MRVLKLIGGFRFQQAKLIYLMKIWFELGCVNASLSFFEQCS